MCGLVAEIFMLVFGIMALVTGKFTLTRARVVTGVPARVVGAILVLPLPLALVMGFLLGAVLVAQGKQITRDEVQKYAAPLELGIILICMLTAVIVAAITAHPPQKKGPPLENEEGDEINPPLRHGDYDRDEGYQPPLPRPPDDRIRE